MSIIILLFIDLTHIHTYRKHSIMKLSVMRNECLGLFRWYHTYKICGSKEFLIISFKKCISSSLHVVLCISTDFSCYQTLNCTSSMSWTTPGRWDIHSMHTHIFIDQSPTVLIDRWHTHEIIINIKNNYHDLMLKIVSFFFQWAISFGWEQISGFPRSWTLWNYFQHHHPAAAALNLKGISFAILNLEVFWGRIQNNSMNEKTWKKSKLVKFFQHVLFMWRCRK